jgi:hypothetical protein
LANELYEISDKWTRRPKYDDIDEYLFESIAQTSEHRVSFHDSISNVEHLLELQIPPPQQQHLYMVLYVNVITAVETYLSDLFISAVGNDKALLRRFVETTPEFKNEKIAVSDVFKIADEIEKKARTYLMDVVWHHLNRVKPMFKDTLCMSFPDDTNDLFKAVLIRHDLVHRNGKKKEGGEHYLSQEAIRSLIRKATAFVEHLDKQWSQKSKI